MDEEIEVRERTGYLVLVPLSLLGLGVLFREPYVSLTGVLLLSLFLYARYEINTIDINIENHLFEGNRKVGESFEIEHEVKSERKTPIKLSSNFDESFDVAKKPDGERRPGSTFTSRLVPNKRGYQSVGKFKTRVQDPFKFFEKTQEHEIDLELIVSSSQEEIEKAQTHTERFELLVRSMHFTSTSDEFETVREYQPGDPAKEIHWKSFSKFQRLMTKEYEQQEPVGAHIMLDCSPSMRRVLPDGTSKLEHAIHVSLQILKNFQLLGHGIGLTAYDRKEVIFHEGTREDITEFERLYKRVNELPGPKEKTDISFDRYDPEALSSLHKSEKRFSERLETLDPDPLSGGIISALEHLQKAKGKKNLVIIISDIEMDPNAAVEAIGHLTENQNLVWLVVPFSPWYEVQEINEEAIEKAYQEYERLEEILMHIEELGARIFELYPDKEGLMILEERGERE